MHNPQAYIEHLTHQQPHIKPCKALWGNICPLP